MTIRRPITFSLLLLAIGPLWAASESSCRSLCGEWRLDAAASDAPEQVLDTAFAGFKDPKPRRRSGPPPADTDPATAGQMMDEEALKPTLNRLPREELRKELRQMMRQPATLTLSASNKDIRIASSSGPGDRFTPGGSHTRVDRYGTARISTTWKGSRLTVVESYDRKNVQETSFSMRNDGSLEVRQVITRTGLPRVSFRTIYQPSAPALESGP